tara:strand:+ start:131 stop:580 length:450 start_codon:yes stop_codon:yes gene_type:complete
MTGAGPGLMEAVNAGAETHQRGQSIGCAIKIPSEQKVNDFLDKHIMCRFFCSRKVLMTRFACGFIALPGGFGTLDELFEMITLVKTERIPPFPIILIDKGYWQPMFTFIESSLLKTQAISEKELKAISLVDSVDEAIEILQSEITVNDE